MTPFFSGSYRDVLKPNSGNISILVAAESRHCTIALTGEPQHIVGGIRPQSVQSEAVGCGTESHPWSVEALAGQRIAVSLVDIGNSIIFISYRCIHVTDDYFSVYENCTPMAYCRIIFLMQLI